MILPLPLLPPPPPHRHQFEYRSARTGEFYEDINQARLIGNYFEDMGALLSAGLLDRKLTAMTYSNDISRAWEALEPLVAIGRRDGGKAIWENFEYATMLSQRWMRKHPDGSYPTHEPRLVVEDPWVEADRGYAASLVGV